MSFEIKDGKEHIPDEEDVYGVNDADERDLLESIFGGTTQEQRTRRRKARMRVLAVLVVIAFALAFGFLGLRHLLGW